MQLKTPFRFGIAALLLGLLSGCYPENYYPENGYSGYYGGDAYGWNNEDAYWRNHYAYEPYYNGYGYDTYQPAFYFGVESYQRYGGRRWEDVDERDLRARWEQSHHDSHMDWAHAREATHAAYNRVYQEQHQGAGGRGDRDHGDHDQGRSNWHGGR